MEEKRDLAEGQEAPDWDRPYNPNPQPTHPSINQTNAKLGFFEALAELQGDIPDIPRGKTVSVRTQGGGSYQFSYAPYEQIVSTVRPILKKHGFSFCHIIDNDYLRTRLIHGQDGFLEAVSKFPQTRNMQELGSAITYLRRYHLSALLGVATDEDDDANIASGNEASDVPKGPARKKAASKKATAKKQEGVPNEAQQTGGTLKPGMVRILRAKMDHDEETEHALCQDFGLEKIDDLPADKMNEAIEWAEKNRPQS